MGKFVFRISVFFLLLIITDIALGIFFKLYDYTQGGEIHKIHSIMSTETPDLVIMGSSRALHHYNPDILSSHLGIDKVFNAGLDGQGAVISYALFRGLSSRDCPRYVICEITPQFDILEQNMPNFTILYPYISINGIKDIITKFDKTENIKLLFNSYKLNSALFRLFPSILIRRGDLNFGFEPLYGKISNPSKETVASHRELYNNVSQTKEDVLRDFIIEAQDLGIKLIFTISPVFGGDSKTTYNEEIRIINEYKLPVLDHLNDERFIYNEEFFQDKVHLNNNGATKYSMIIAREVEAIISKTDSK